MSNTIDLIGELYKPLLESLHIFAGPNDILHLQRRGAEKLCEISGKKLTLPTNDNLKNLVGDEYMFFHPLSENIARGDSAVYNYLKLAITLRLNMATTELAETLLTIAADKQLDGKLKSHQLGLLAAIPKITDKTIKNFAATVQGVDVDKNVFVSIYNKRNGKIQDTTYNRVAVTRFPLIEQLANPEDSAYWSKPSGMRKSDYANYLALFNYIFPDWEVINAYSGYSDSMEAPSFHALVSAYLNVMGRINQVANDFADVANVTEIIAPQLPQIKAALDNLPRYANIIPPLNGNIGDVGVADSNSGKMQTQPMGIPPSNLLAAADKKASNIQANEQVQQPMNTQQPVYNQQQPQQPQQQPYPQQGYPQQQSNQPRFIGYPQPQPYPQQGYYPPQGYPQGYPQPGGYLGYPQPQQGYQQIQPAPSSNPFAAWQSEVNRMTMPPQGYYPPQGYPQGYPQQNVYPQQGYYPQQNPYPQQGYPQPVPPAGYPQYPRPTFQPLGAANQQQPQAAAQPNQQQGYPQQQNPGTFNTFNPVR